VRSRERSYGIRAFIRGLCPVLALCCSDLAHGDVAGPIHWAYSPYFGTGAYSIDTGESVYVLTFRPGWSLRGPQLDGNGKRMIGLRVRVPITIGLHELESSDLGRRSIWTTSAR
jgi:hypothetical protein